MAVPGIVTDEPWRWDDPRLLQHRVNEWEIRPAELVGEEAVDGEHDVGPREAVDALEITKRTCNSIVLYC